MSWQVPSNLSWDQYYSRLASGVASRSSCCRRQVGALIVVDRAIVSTGYNGTPSGVTNCNEGGCLRCAGTAVTGSGYDTCVCVHAEQNAILLAARRGTSTDRGIIYCTLRPCFSCVKESIQAGIKEMVYAESHSEAYTPELEAQYASLIRSANLIVRKLE